MNEQPLGDLQMTWPELIAHRYKDPYQARLELMDPLTGEVQFSIDIGPTDTVLVSPPAKIVQIIEGTHTAIESVIGQLTVIGAVLPDDMRAELYTFVRRLQAQSEVHKALDARRN